MKFLIITGGVISGVGKGVAAAVSSTLLRLAGYKTRIKKFDPYFNVDPGTLNPAQHGEVYITEDGIEADLDLGHYERIGGVKTSKDDYTTMGSVICGITQKERAGGFHGRTVQSVPDVTDAIKERFYCGVTDEDVVICEIGGTVGDIEGVPFLEAARQLKNARFMHIPCLFKQPWINEIKTKPAQHSVNELRKHGINPNILACRNDTEVDAQILAKLSRMCGIEHVHVLANSQSLYDLPAKYQQAGLYESLINVLELESRQCVVPLRKEITKQTERTIAIVGKYNTLDAYRSLEEALQHAYYHLNIKSKIVFLDSEEEWNDEQYAGIIVPGGFGGRGIEGKIKAISYAIQNKIPFLGICLGMQLTVIEGLRRIGINANSVEFDSTTQEPAICLVKRWTEGGVEKIGRSDQVGGTLRLGGQKSILTAGSRIAGIYKADSVHRRHRHRYEVNPAYQESLATAGLVVTGYSPDGLIEIIEKPDHPWFVGVQYHPEFSSLPTDPEQLILDFVRAVEGV